MAETGTYHFQFSQRLRLNTCCKVEGLKFSDEDEQVIFLILGPKLYSKIVCFLFACFLTIKSKGSSFHLGSK